MLTTNFIRGYNPVWSMVNLQGQQFDSTYYLWVLTNTFPYIPATVFEDASGTTPWTNPIQFLANGTLPENIFWDDTQVYRLEIRQNITPPPTQADPLIYLIEDYIPGSANSELNTNNPTLTDNQITNPQFSLVNFSGSYNLIGASNPPSINFAPGWYLDLMGNGNVTLTQMPLTSAVPTPTNAPYCLHMTLTGSWSSAILRQRFLDNGLLWSGKNVSTSITAMINGATAILTANLTNSNNQPLAVLLSTPLSNNFEEYTGNALIPTVINPDVPPNAWIDYKIILPNSVDMYITSVQVIASEMPVNFEYEQDTINRQIDHTFNYYQPSLFYKPIPSYLIGWDFPLNPAQILGDSVPANGAGANMAYYAWDQTIIFQNQNNAVVTDRATNGGIQTAVASGKTGVQYALVQYLDQIQARKILSDRASVHMNMFGQVNGGGSGTVTLWATTATPLPVLPSSFITGLGPTGIPTVISGWIQVPNILQNNKFNVPPISTTNAESNDIYLNGWDMQAAFPTNAATYFAIVVGFAPMSGTLPDTIVTNSISLCAGDIATRPSPKTYDETLTECEQYYEKSYAPNVLVGTVTNVNYLSSNQGIELGGSPTGTFFSPSGFDLQYRAIKRIITPTVNLYSPANGGAAGLVDAYIKQNGSAVLNSPGYTFSSSWTLAGLGNKYCGFSPTARFGYLASNVNLGAAYINYHYLVDARLGVV